LTSSHTRSTSCCGEGESLLAEGAGDSSAGELLVGTVQNGLSVDIVAEFASQHAGAVAIDQDISLSAR